jgi:hypothetical protein
LAALQTSGLSFEASFRPNYQPSVKLTQEDATRSLHYATIVIMYGGFGRFGKQWEHRLLDKRRGPPDQD